MKKFILVLSVISLIFTLFAGCSGTEGSSTDGTHTTTTTTATTTTTTTAPQTEDPNNSVQDETNPKSDFEYVENEDGGITITKYIGTDDSVVIPEAIDGKPVDLVFMLLSPEGNGADHLTALAQASRILKDDSRGSRRRGRFRGTGGGRTSTSRR